MKIKNLKSKFQRNKILFYLIFLALLTSLVGVYYNSVREIKTIYNFAVKDGPNKDYRLFFIRNSDLDEDKKVTEELFKFKYGTIINLYKNNAYFIYNENQSQDKVLSYDFKTKTSKIIYENPKNEILSDVYLDNQNLVILTQESLIKVDINTLKDEEETFKSKMVVNEIINIKNDKLIFGYDNCKFNKDICKFELISNLIVLETKTKNQELVKIIDNKNENIENLSYFGTNKAFRKGEIGVYQNDKGNRNFSLRVFTQF